jgi:hypothetical protein
MPSDIEIANRAITKVGGTRITSFNDSSTEARALSATYNMARRALLRRAAWNFAVWRGTLPKLLTTPSWGFKFQYQLPADFIRLLQVNDYSVALGLSDGRQYDDTPYAIEGGKLLTDYDAPLKVRMIVDVVDANLFDACFAEAFASQLAYEICEQVTQSNSKKSALAQEVVMWINEAKRMDAVESPAEAIHDDSWVLAKY